MDQSAATHLNPEAGAWTVIMAGPADALGRALEQAAGVSPPARTLVLITARRPVGLDTLPPGRAHVLVEPLDRGTAASLLFPVHWIRAIDPEATVVVFGDGAPASAGAVADGIAQATRLVECRPESLILLALPSGGRGPDGDPFIVPGERVGAHPWAADVCNGAVFIGRAKAFIRAAADHAAALNDRLARAATFAGQEHERWALRQAYALAPSVDFFGSVLRPIASGLTVLEIRDVDRAGDRHGPALEAGSSPAFGTWTTATAPG